MPDDRRLMSAAHLVAPPAQPRSSLYSEPYSVKAGGAGLRTEPTAHAAGSMATIALILRRLMITRMNIPNRGTQRKAANQGNERNAAKKCQLRQSAAGLVPQMTTER
jgi:hypothetical protein